LASANTKDQTGTGRGRASVAREP